jgi:hypothetical protein
MEIESTSLYREISNIINGPSKPVHYQWTAQVHANGQNLNVLKVLSIDIVQDFEMKYADETYVELSILGGMYAHDIYPYQSNLEITLFRRPLQEVGDSADTTAPIQTERYAVTLLDSGNPLLEANGINSPSKEDLNLTNIFEIKFQLVNKAIEQIRMRSIGGIYRDTTTENVIKSVLTKESKNVVVEGSRIPKGVDMIPASNQVKRDHVIIPHGTLLVHLPEFIHRRCGGIYNAGMGYYMQGDYWYVYPCYDTTRFAASTRTLTIINVPKNKFPNVERTYRLDGTNLVIMATGDVKFSDDSDQQQLNYGNGVRFADGDNFMQKFVTTAGNKTIASRAKNNSEFVGTKRPNGNNNIRSSEKAISSNAMVEYSKIARRQGSVLSLIWENSLPELLYPGMMVKLLYMDGEIIKTIYGVTLKAHHYVQTNGNGLITGSHKTVTMLAVFVQRLKD